MLGLVAYNSDEDEDIRDAPPLQIPPVLQQDQLSTQTVKTPFDNVDQLKVAISRSDAEISNNHAQSTSNGVPTDLSSTTLAPMGPVIGPSRPPDVDAEENDQAAAAAPPLSPYSATRSLQRTYTMPTLSPDFIIPDSPPGSPDPTVAKKFERFLALKQQNTHFNTKLSQSSALRNPNLLGTLLSYVASDADENAVESEGQDVEIQYSSNWAKKMWDSSANALGKGILKQKDETFVAALARLQKEGAERRLNNRSVVDFVGSSSVSTPDAGGAGMAISSRQTAASASSSSAPKSAAERIMAGLDRDSRKNTPEPVRDGGGRGGKRRDDGYREKRSETDGRRRKSRSRSRSREREKGRYRDRDYGKR